MSLSRLTKFRGMVATSAALVAVIVVSATVLTGQGGRSENFSLDSVSTADLSLVAESNGMSISPADQSDSPPVDADAAAAKAFPGLPVLEAKLARVTTWDNEQERLAWVVSFDPSKAAVPAGPPPLGKEEQVTELTTRVFMAFIDAASGEFIYGAAISSQN